MPESQGRKVFRIQLTLPVVIILTTLSTFSLAAAFYLGMVTEKSMQRPPEFPELETNIAMGYVPYEGHLSATGFPIGNLGKKYKVHLPKKYSSKAVDAVVVKIPFTQSFNANTREVS